MRPTSNGAGGVAHLIDIQTMDGDLYYWSDRSISGIVPALSPSLSPPLITYDAWITQPPTFQRNRSLATDTGTFKVANVFGDTLATKLERSLRKSSFEGAEFVYRWWAISAEIADLEVHGTLTVGDVSQPEVTISAVSSFDGSNRKAPEWQFTESCQLVWGLVRCGSTQHNECLYTLQSCQVLEHFVGITNTFYDKNFADALTSVARTPVNRRRGV